MIARKSWITAVIHEETRRFHPMSQSAALLVPMVRRLSPVEKQPVTSGFAVIMSSVEMGHVFVPRRHVERLTADV
jgi:hypothetical protein